MNEVVVLLMVLLLDVSRVIRRGLTADDKGGRGKGMAGGIVAADAGRL